MTESYNIRRIDHTETEHVEICRTLLQELSLLHAALEPALAGQAGNEAGSLRRFHAALDSPHRATVLAALQTDVSCNDADDALPQGLRLRHGMGGGSGRTTVVGLAVLHLNTGDAIPSGRQVAVLTDLIVSHEKRRVGIGRQLLAAALHWAGDTGAEVLAVQVRERNAGAIGFYEAGGYCTVSRWMTMRSSGPDELRPVPL